MGKVDSNQTRAGTTHRGHCYCRSPSSALTMSGDLCSVISGRRSTNLRGLIRKARIFRLETVPLQSSIRRPPHKNWPTSRLWRPP